MENRDDQNQNQTDQQGQQGQSPDKQNQQGFSQQGQTSTGQSGDDTTLAQGQKNQADKQREDEAASDKGFVGSNKEDSSDAYLSQDETAKTDFAETGQGATETRSDEDIESGKPTTRDPALDDGS